MRRFVLLSLAGVLASAAVAHAGSCVFTVSMQSGLDVNNLDFRVNYQLVDNGDVEGSVTKPDCVSALGGALASFHDKDDSDQLLASLIRLNDFTAPVPLIACRIFFESLEPAPSDFSVVVTNAGRGGEDNNVVPLPDVDVTKVECPGEFPDVTTTTTTTLLPDTTTTTIDFGEARCGFPASDGEVPTASDALFTLRAAVGASACPLCVCDVNDSGDVAAGDALAILRAAVGRETELDCPAC